MSWHKGYLILLGLLFVILVVRNYSETQCTLINVGVVGCQQ